MNKQPMDCKAQLVPQLYEHFLGWPKTQ